MEIKMSEKQFRRLLDMVYIGNWVLNSARGGDRIRVYDQVESLLFSQCLLHDMPDLVDVVRGIAVPSRAFNEGGIHEAIMAYEDNTFFEILAQELALTQEAGQFGGLIVGSMLGPTIVFTIPVALGIIKKEDRPYLGAGVLAGMITIPIGCIVGGLVMNMTPYKMDIGRILINLVPVIVIAALIVIGLWFAPGPMINGFNKFGTGVTVVITVLTAIAVFQQITGIMFPVFDVMSTVDPDLVRYLPGIAGAADAEQRPAGLRPDRHCSDRRLPHGGVDHPYLRRRPVQAGRRPGHE